MLPLLLRPARPRLILITSFLPELPVHALFQPDNSLFWKHLLRLKKMESVRNGALLSFFTGQLPQIFSSFPLIKRGFIFFFQDSFRLTQDNCIMPNFNPEFVGDKSFAANHLLDIITNLQEWNKYSMPDTESLRRIISVVDWASREPKRWLVFRIFYLEGITDIHLNSAWL